MNFIVPTDLRQKILYIWKIIDRPTINLDELYNFITYELYLTSLSKSKENVQKSINSKYLVEDSKKEEVRLGDDLQGEFDKWQNGGEKKVKQMKTLLSQSWRPELKNIDEMRYSVFEGDLLDVSVRNKSGLIRSSAVKVDQLDFSSGIIGKISDTDEEGHKINYSFEIYPKSRKIIHNCPEYINLRKKQKHFCKHLGRLLMKLYASNKIETIDLVKDLVEKRENWEFS